MGRSRLEEDLWLWLELEYPGEFLREHRFHDKRRWRFDFACPDQHVAIEVDGLVYGGKQGGHQSPKGVTGDREKDAEAMCLGWKVLRLSPKMLREGTAYDYIRKLMRK